MYFFSIFHEVQVINNKNTENIAELYINKFYLSKSYEFKIHRNCSNFHYLTKKYLKISTNLIGVEHLKKSKLKIIILDEAGGRSQNTIYSL